MALRRYRHWSIFALLVSGCSAHADIAPTQNEVLDINPQQATEWMPTIGSVRDHIIVLIAVNGQPVKVAIDTGNTLSTPLMLSARAAKRLGLVMQGSTESIAYGGLANHSVARVDRFEFGAWSARNIQVSVTSGNPFGESIDGVIGMALLLHGTLQVDSAGHRVRFLFDSELSREAVAGTFTAVSEGTPPSLVSVEAKVCGKPIQLILDSGDNDDIVLDRNVLPVGKCRSEVSSDVQADSPAGVTTDEVVGLASLRIAGVQFGPVLAKVIPHEQAVRLHMVGSVGMGVLSRSNFALDMGSHRLAIYGPVHPDSAFYRPRIGLQFHLQPDRLIITHIEANSPATSSGLKPGDAICKVRGKSVADWRGAFDTNPPEGTRLKLEVCDGRNVVIVARDFLKPPGDVPAVDLAPFPTSLGWYSESVWSCFKNQDIDACTAVIGVAHPRDSLRSLALLFRAKGEEKREDIPAAKADYLTILREHPGDPLALAALNRIKLTAALRATP